MGNTAIRDPRDTQGIRHQYTVDHTGPMIYVTGGETIEASRFGFKEIAQVIAGASQDALYQALPLFLKNSSQPEFTLLWLDLTTGLEVGAGIDLSASPVRLTVIGR